MITGPGTVWPPVAGGLQAPVRAGGVVAVGLCGGGVADSASRVHFKHVVWGAFPPFRLHKTLLSRKANKWKSSSPKLPAF